LEIEREIKMTKKLHRNMSNSKLFGVCAGLADYLEVDVTIIRVIWAVVTLFYGTGLLLYILAAFIMPEA
jgi:phage shock protein PspC (stress-responsive transcriptional regulator)